MEVVDKDVNGITPVSEDVDKDSDVERMAEYNEPFLFCEASQSTFLMTSPPG